MLTTSIKVYFDNVKRFEDKALFDSEYQTMPLSRRQNIDKMRFDKDKRLSLGAGVLLRDALKEFGITEYEVVYTEKGKPFIPDLEDKVKFSLSHSSEMVMCVLSFDENGNAPSVGCDIEEIKPIDLKIPERFFTEEDYKEILSSDDKDSAFYRLWTLKESFLKLKGEGLSFGLNSVRTVSSKEYEFVEIDEIDGYKAAYCVEVQNGKEEK